jgi:hypothetical protein
MAHMKAWAGEHASGAASAATVVLVTSGPPDACSPGDAQGMANVAQEGLESAPSVRTHIVAMSPEAMAADWDIVSLSGGTNPAWSDADADADANPGAMLHGALRRLFLSPVECAYVLPTTGSGDDWSDQSRVAVTYTSTAGTFQVPLVPLTHDCGPDGGFYLVPAAPNSSPARIEFCPSTCVAVQGGEVELAYACPRGPVPTG